MNGRVRTGAIAVAAAVVVIMPALIVYIKNSGDTAAPPSVPPSDSRPAEVLISRGRPTAASSSAECCPPGNVVDGNASTAWSSSSDEEPQWIFVDLGATARVSRVRLHWDRSCAQAYRLETSADREAWTPIHATSTGDGDLDDMDLTGSGRYVRLYAVEPCHPGEGYSLREFEILGSTDSQPPTTPTNVRQVGVTPTSVTVAWDASTDDVGVAFYDVFKDGQLVITVAGTETSGVAGGLTPNQDYGIYVNARDAAGNVSDPSPTLSVHMPGTDDATAPTAPSGLRSTSVSATCVTLQWTAATDDVAVTGYVVYDDKERVGSANTTRTQVCGLTAKSTYRFTVTAVDGNQNEGPASDQYTVTTGRACDQPICDVRQIASDNDIPWGLVTLPDGSVLYNRRDAFDIIRLVPGTGSKSTVGRVPNVDGTDGEGGLLGLAISPNFANDRWLYIMHTSPSDNRIVRIKMTTGNRLDTGSLDVLLTGIRRNKYHNGGRLRWGPDGKLYASTGDAQNGNLAQDRNSLNGKILRLNPDGGVPSDNPFNNHVWSYGHRNPQGLAFDSQGRLWEQEFGNSEEDELNLIQRGGNYGWPNCEGTVSHGGSDCGTPGYIGPKRTWGVSECSCSGIAIVDDVIYVGAQRGQRLWRLVISGTRVTGVQSFFQGTYGRIRTVEPAPGGGLWMSTTNGDKDSTANNSNTKIFRLSLG